MSRFSVDSSSEPESDSDYEFDDEATFDVDLKTIEHASAGTFALVAQMLEVHPSERIFGHSIVRFLLPMTAANLKPENETSEDAIPFLFFLSRTIAHLLRVPDSLYMFGSMNDFWFDTNKNETFREKRDALVRTKSGRWVSGCPRFRFVLAECTKIGGKHIVLQQLCAQPM